MASPGDKPLIDRSRIEALVRQALAHSGDGDIESIIAALGGGANDRRQAPGRSGIAGSGPLDSSGAVLLSPDRGANVPQPFDPPSMRAILDATPARIGVGRVGTRYKTNTLLRFRADHAAAKEAVMSDVDPELLRKLGLLVVSSRATSKAHFLQRPDAGRALSDEGREIVATRVPRGLDVVLVYGDGLSAMALNTHLAPFHETLARELAARSIRTATPIFVKLSRVKVMDEIARITGTRSCVFVCGERPGLGFADSMSAYYGYVPASGQPTDADREVISNINPRGLEPTRAAAAVADAVARVLRDKKSGVMLG